MARPPDRPSESLEQRAWSSYWSSGALTSLPEDFRANYDGEIRQFWRDRCASLPDGASVLDVCTGNGAVALLIAEAVSDRGVAARVTAVDLAEIRPELVAKRFPVLAEYVQSIRFVGGRAFEDVAIDDSSQDLIVSQYGIEYCEQEAAAAQCSRLLKSGGELAIITHAPDSDMRATMQAELEQFERLESLGIVAALNDWENGRIDTTELKGLLAGAGQALRAEPALQQSGLYQYALGLCEQAGRLTDAQLAAQKPALISAARQLEDGRSRLAQMLEVNRRLKVPDEWAQAFVRAGLELVESSPLRYRSQHDVGHRFRFVKPAG